MPDAVALGELLIDFVSTEEDVPLSHLPRFAGAAGGAPANVAVGLARLGVSAGFIGKVGDDPFGEFLRRTLMDAGVETVGLHADAEARTTLAFVATRRDGRKDIAFYRNPGADMLLTGKEINPDYIRSARLFHFGSVSLSRSPAREATLHAARVAREAGLLVSYDPNWRPGLWEDVGEAVDANYTHARRVIWEPMGLADVVHCAEEEWEFITGVAGMEEGARKILEAGPKLVVVTRGERGCCYDDGRDRGDLPGFQVEVADTLGAGDAFVAAMLSKLMDRREKGTDTSVAQPTVFGGRENTNESVPFSAEEYQAIMAYANAAGALTCTKHGVIPALPTAAEIEGFLSERGKNAAANGERT